MAFPFQTEVSLHEWHYQQGARYRSASEIVTRLMQNVSRNGCLLLNITQHGRGDIDPEARQICLDFGRWIEINSEAIYSARPFDVWGNEHVIYTRQGGYIYATILHPATEDIVLQPLSTQSPSVGKILKVEMLENGRSIPFKQSAEGLTIQIKQSVTQGITNQELAQGFKVLRITHDKTWFNDDDPGVRTYGWNRTTGKGTGDFNNDISFSDQVGDRWSVPFSGKRISIIAPTGEHEGRMQIVTDGKACGEVAFHKGTERKAQQVVFTSNKLKKGKHTLELVNLEGTIAVDALKIE